MSYVPQTNRHVQETESQYAMPEYYQWYALMIRSTQWNGLRTLGRVTKLDARFLLLTDVWCSECLARGYQNGVFISDSRSAITRGEEYHLGDFRSDEVSYLNYSYVQYEAVFMWWCYRMQKCGFSGIRSRIGMWWESRNSARGDTTSFIVFSLYSNWWWWRSTFTPQKKEETSLSGVLEREIFDGSWWRIGYNNLHDMWPTTDVSKGQHC